MRGERVQGTTHGSRNLRSDGKADRLNLPANPNRGWSLNFVSKTNPFAPFGVTINDMKTGFIFLKYTAELYILCHW